MNHDTYESTLPERVAKELGLQTAHSRYFLQVCFENAQLFDKKQLDYGPKNIIGFGVFGIIVRMNDKFERMKNLFMKKRKPRNESMKDALRDIANYAMIATMVDTGRWPNE
jgi:hypothetical protein